MLAQGILRKEDKLGKVLVWDKQQMLDRLGKLEEQLEILRYTSLLVLEEFDF